MSDNNLIQENNNLKEQLKYFIPRRRVRRVYKMLQKILEIDGEELLDNNFISKDKIELLLRQRLDKYIKDNNERYKECKEIFELLLNKKYRDRGENNE